MFEKMATLMESFVFCSLILCETKLYGNTFFPYYKVL